MRSRFGPIFLIFLLLLCACDIPKPPDATSPPQAVDATAVATATPTPVGQIFFPYISHSRLATAQINVRFSIPSANPPPTIFYAVGSDGSFYKQEAPFTGSNASYLLEVASGSYQVYARSIAPNEVSYYGTWKETGGLVTIDVPDGSSVNVTLTPPPDRCNPIHWLPASPDGRFPPVSHFQVQLGCGTPTSAPTITPGISFTARINVRFSTPNFDVPPTIIYAVSPSGSYYWLTAAANLPGTVHPLSVPPGNYQVYARSTIPGDISYFGAWAGTGGLITYALADNSTVDVTLRQPLDQCNPAYWLPASPDGRFLSIADQQVQLGCGTPTRAATNTPISTPTSGTTARINVKFSIPSTTPPPVVIYVVSLDGKYYTRDAPLTSLGTSYLFDVPPGSYQIYARSSLSGDISYFGAWAESGGLITYALAISTELDLTLTPPPNKCNPTYWLPASPDGRFPSIANQQAQLGCGTPASAATNTPVSTPTRAITAWFIVSFNIPAITSPPVRIYAVNLDGKYYTQEAPLTSGGTSYLFEVLPGNYQVYARSTLTEDVTYYGVWASTGGLQIFQVQAGDQLSNIVLTPPPDPCDPNYGLPASPDGRFPPTSEYASKLGCQ